MWHSRPRLCLAARAAPTGHSRGRLCHMPTQLSDTTAACLQRNAGSIKITASACRLTPPPSPMPPPPSSLQEICTLFGQPVAGNPTQYMIEKAFAHHGLDWRYLTLEVAPEDLSDAVRGMRAMGFRGGNITKPHKVAVVQWLDRLSDAAALMGAVNCIVREDRHLVGENTDGKGFMQSLTGLTDPAGKRVVLFGAGGAARAIGVELALSGAAGITVVNRSAERGQELVALLNSKTQTAATLMIWSGDFSIPHDVEIV